MSITKPECTQACGMLPQFVDGDLVPEESAWLADHMKSCADCRATLETFQQIDSEVTRWGQCATGLTASRAREALDAKLRSLPAGRRRTRWTPAVAAGIAAALALAILWPQRKAPAVNHQASSFVAIPYLPPLDPRENTAIVRMNIRVATLIAVGYKVVADPNEIVPAEVVVGEDGRAHAIRVLSGIDWNGRGD